MTSFALPTLCVALALLAATTAERNVVGGTNARTGQFPQLVSIHFNNQAWCGGSIIDRSWILTAAHCMVDDNRNFRNTNSFRILAGTTDISPPSSSAVWRSVENYWIHGNYRRFDSGNDIALIKLSQPLPLNNNIQLVKLAQQNPNDGQQVTVAGWGKYDNENPRAPQISRLQMANLYIVNRNQCSNSNNWSIPRDQICAGYNGNDLRAECNGDSGGPLFAVSSGSWQQVGVVSWSKKDNAGRCGLWPGMYTSVPAQLNWIRQQSGLWNL